MTTYEDLQKAYDKGYVEAIENCKTILKLHHMFRTCEDDFNAKIEVPFYTRLWKKFDQLKEQNNADSN